MPSPMALHLLCPRSPWIDDLRAHFLSLPDNTGPPLLLDMEFNISLQMVLTQLMDVLKRIEQHGDSTMPRAIDPFALDILRVCLKSSPL